GLSDCDNTHACCFRLLNSFFHCEDADQLPHPAVTVDHCGNRSLKYNLRSGFGMNGSFFNSFVIPYHPLHPVAFDSVEIRLQKHVCDLSAFLFAEAESSESVPAKPVQSFK